MFVWDTVLQLLAVLEQGVNLAMNRSARGFFRRAKRRNRILVWHFLVA
jgi:hypothetical protein